MRVLTGIVGSRSYSDGTVVAQRAVQSSGGVAGGVVSESQGYGLLLAGLMVARVGPAHARRAELVQTALELFEGWRRMCEATSGGTSCQSGTALCGVPAVHECLPSWQFDGSITSEVGTGSAPDGDEDAILGMIFLVLATQSDSPRPLWWTDVARWT